MGLYNLDWGKLRKWRIERLTSQMKESGIDAFLLHGYLNVKYVTDQQMRESHAYGEAQDYVLLLQSGEYVFFSNPFFRLETREYCPWIKRIENPDQIFRIVEELKLSGATVGLDPLLSYQLVDEIKRKYPSMKLCDAQKYLDEAKAIKSPEELKVMREAAMIGEVGMAAGLAAIRAGISEYKIAQACESAVWGEGAFPFNTYVASGFNTAITAEDIFQKRIREGDLIYIDTGCVFGGYVIEFARTTVCGKPSDEQKKIYKTVYDALQESFKALKPGVSTFKIKEIQDQVLSNTGYPRVETSSVHSIGVGYHEWPSGYLKENDWRYWEAEEVELRPGMVVNIQPAIYTQDPEIGGARLEDTVEITEEGSRVLTKTPYCDDLLF
jgi:Xaa-Pro aminopeptidase